MRDAMISLLLILGLSACNAPGGSGPPVGEQVSQNIDCADPANAELPQCGSERLAGAQNFLPLVGAGLSALGAAAVIAGTGGAATSTVSTTGS